MSRFTNSSRLFLLLKNGFKRPAYILGRGFVPVGIETVVTRSRYSTAAKTAIFASTLALPFLLCSPAINDSDIKASLEKTITVDPAVTPFPYELTPESAPVSTDFTMLGYGVRTVTFLSFKVYGIGIYVATKDLELIPKVLNSQFMKALTDVDKNLSHKENVQVALDDDENSRIVIDNILAAGVRMVAKITPLRNTDFKHMKDGLIKSILKHPGCKLDPEAVKRGIEELRNAISRKGSMPKDNDLYLELLQDGSLQASYYDRKNDKSMKIGNVSEPLIGKLLFGQYLSGGSPLCEKAKLTSSKKIVDML
ncbi:HEL319Cp [Eremothecium sinecaudum]|uniref:Altered inheritance of mitochondria protein 18, mitochondrial n=1 Tax=Eremothecium sinecaudum TaxID=45286 RepID=A0A0X8HT04_9SACH|nr:HEL319Cp [Eremothecium sinecaudum]AMD20962.1 HEL319Cp [Eremothecium sinecaudum]